MIKVECPGCKAPYQVDERRVPDQGLKMRCPKCATSFVVTKPGAAPAAAAKPAAPKPAAAAPARPAPQAAPPPAAPRAAESAEWDLPMPTAAKSHPGAPPRADTKARDAVADADWDLPAPTAAKGPPGAPPAAQKRAPAAPPPLTDDDGDVDLPVVAPRGPAGPFAPKPAAKPPAAAPGAPGRGFGEIDLMVDLPAPGPEGDAEMDLPVARDASSKPRGAPPPVAKPAAAPAPAAAKDATGAPVKRNRTQLFGDTVPDPAAPAPPAAPAAAAPIRVPVPARGSAPGRARSAAPSDPGPARPPMSSDLDFGPRAAPAPSPDAVARANARTAPDPTRTARTAPDPSRAARNAPTVPDAARPQSVPMGPQAAPNPGAPRAPMDSNLELRAAAEVGFGEIDLPLLASEADLPAPSQGTNLPIPAAGLPVPAAGLPTPVEGAALPARQMPGLPVATAGTTLPLATDGTTLPVRGNQRLGTPMDLPRQSSSDLGGIDGPAVHGPGHVAGADLYTGPAAYDDRHMDPAFQPRGARNVPASTADAEEAPLMTTSGAPVAGRGAQRTSSERISGEPRISEPRISEPRISNSAEPRLTRGAAQASMADLIDRTSIELDLIEPTAPPAPDARAGASPQAPAQAFAPAAPAQPFAPAAPPNQRVATPPPISVPDLAASVDAPRPPAPRFADDLLNEATNDVFGAPDAGTEAPLAPDGAGDEADLDGRPTGGRAAAGSKLPAVPKEDASKEEEPRKRPWIKYLVAVAVTGLAAGAAAGFVPDIGPFGLNFVSDRVNAKLQNDALDTVRSLVQADLEPDVSSGADRALGKIKTGQQAYPRHRATAGYAAFVAYSRGLRFGPRAEDKAYGDMMVRVSRDRQSDFLLLGQAAQDAANGQIARARQTAQGLLERRPQDIDVAVLAGEVELLARSGDQATKVWQRAVDIKKVPRTLFGLARAQYAANDLIGAEASAKSALDMSPKHVGARTLLAAIVWQNGGREQQALELLGKVTEDGDIRASAGDPELVAAYTQLGNIHLAKSRMTQAEQAFAAALKIDPQAVNALVGNGELFYRSGRYTEAVARYEAAIRADADSVSAKIGMAKTLLHLERAKDAKDLLKKLCEARPNEPAAFAWLGAAEEALGNKKEAEAAYTSAIKVGGDSPGAIEAYVSLARLLSSLGRTEDANARLNEANTRFPGMPALHRARGEVALSAGNYDEAKKEFEAALAREDDLGTKFKLATTLRRMHQYEDATRLFDQISEADKDFPGLALERGLLFEETGQSERATEMYAKALQSAPNDLDLKLRVGSTQVMAGHAKQAEAILRDVFRAKPNSAEVNHFLGRALLVRGTSLAEAKRFLVRATELDANNAEYHLYVGWVANELGETQLAESALKRAIELDRNLGDAYWQRAVLLQKQGQSLDALNDLKIALEKNHSRYEIYATMASCYQDQSRWPEAEDAWRKAIAGNDQNPEWHYRLAKTYVVRGNKGAATAEFEKAVTLAENPDRPTPGWLAQAHFNLGDALRATDRAKARQHFERYLQLAPQNDPVRDEAQKALQSLGNGP
jgi:predicted Zn finger-like uncharacterized protein